MSTRRMSARGSVLANQLAHQEGVFLSIVNYLFPLPPIKETRTAPLTTSAPLSDDLAQEFGHNAISTQKYTWLVTRKKV